MISARFRITTILMGLLAFLAQPCPALADDDAEALKAGGLVFEKSEALRYLSMSLKISPEEIDIDYAFKNTTREDVTMTIAFPLPELDMRQERKYRLPAPGEAVEFGDPNFLRSETSVEGEKIELNREMHSFAEDGKDITDVLHEMGLNPIVPFPLDPPDGDPAHGTALVEMKAAEAVERASDEETQKEYSGTWKTRISYSWQQTFPAKKTVHIHHTYKPISGTLNMAVSGRDWGKGYCPDDDRRREIRDQMSVAKQYMTEEDSRKSKLSFCAEGETVKYDLKTPQSNAISPEKFTLVLDGGESSFVSLCTSEFLFHKSGDSIVAHETDYEPESDLNILFVHLPINICPEEERVPRDVKPPVPVNPSPSDEADKGVLSSD